MFPHARNDVFEKNLGLKNVPNLGELGFTFFGVEMSVFNSNRELQFNTLQNLRLQ